MPISRQPKEKIQAIIESCARQFPEFGERARKRIRTYLKSCRRTKRHKNSPVTSNENGWNDAASPPVKNSSNHVSYHLTSPMAEQILATACENECQNAKRMRLGLKPLAVNAVGPTSLSVVHEQRERRHRRRLGNRDGCAAGLSNRDIF